MKNKIRKVEDLIVYNKSVEVFEKFIEIDWRFFNKTILGRELGKHQLKTLDSVCANIEEGFSRKFGKEFKYFLRVSKGSTGEAKGRYKRSKRILPEKIILERVDALDEIQSMLYSLINRLKE